MAEFPGETFENRLGQVTQYCSRRKRKHGHGCVIVLVLDFLVLFDYEDEDDDEDEKDSRLWFLLNRLSLDRHCVTSNHPPTPAYSSSTFRLMPIST